MKNNASIYEEYYSSFENEIQTYNISNPNCFESFFAAAYVVILACYLDEDEIFVTIKNHLNKQHNENTIRVDVDFELTFNDFVNVVEKALTENSLDIAEHINAVIIFSDMGQIKDDCFIAKNQSLNNGALIEQELLSFEVDVKSHNQKITYDSKKYTKNHIVDLDKYIKKFISFSLNTPDAQLKSFTLINETDWNKTITDWNCTDSYYPKYESVPKLFKNIALKYPDSIALNFLGNKLTYQELDMASSNLARFLSNYSSPAKVKIIGIYMERGIDPFKAILGILKSGFAYLFIHLHFPPQRIELIVKDAQIETILTQEKLLPKLCGLKNVNLIPMDNILQNFYKGEETLQKINTDDLCYVIYTSGTTGNPKGIKISHKGVCNLITHVNEDFAVKHKTRILQFAPLSFDASVYEWAGGLLNGGELFILAEDELPPKADLSEYMRKNEINFALLPPTILEIIDSNNLDALHTLVSGGEACTENIVSKWSVGRKLLNAYGPSEATVACSFSLCAINKKITIGKAIQNVKLYILNQYQQPIPINVPGELYIGGVGVAQGYLNREDLTKKSFINNPFSSDPKEYIYKTGDRVRRLENGEIEYISRIDKQVKIEGYRIELGEIEEQLLKYKKIKNICVIANNIDEIHKQLIAFYILKDEFNELDNKQLDVFLNKKLPKYMIPAVYVGMSSFPLTQTNKVDHKALINSFQNLHNKPDSKNGNIEIKSILEQTWKELLKCEDIYGNFFSLGGDSIRAIQFVVILRKYGYHITSKNLYEYPTIKELIGLIKNQDKSLVPSIQKYIPAKGELELSPIQKWFFEHKFENFNCWNQAFMFRSLAPIQKELFIKAWNIIIKHHDAFRLRFDLRKDKINQYFSEGEEDKLYILKNLTVPGNNSSSWMTSECIKLQKSLNIENGPVAAIGIFNNHSDGNQRIMIAIHHLIVDGVSWRILLEDLFGIYKQLLVNENVTLPEKSDHYGMWVKALKNYMNKDNTKLQISYWKSITKKLCKSENNCKYYISDQIHHKLSFSKQITFALLHELPNYYPLQINDILLSGLAYALYCESKDCEFIIDLEGHGREECIEGVDVIRTMGWFTTIFPVLLRIPHTFEVNGESLNWGHLLLEVKKELRNIPDKGIGYGVLKFSETAKSRCQINHQTPNILFNYLGQFDLSSEHKKQWEFAKESPGNHMGTDYFGKENYTKYPLEINAVIIHDSLIINFNFNKFYYSDAQVKKLAANYKKALEQHVLLGKKLALGDLYLASDKSQKKLLYQKRHNISEQDIYKPFSLINVFDYKNLIADISLIEDIYPASQQQQRMLCEAEEDSNSTYHIISNFSISSKFNKKKITKIFEKLTKKHELLRACFLKDNKGKFSAVIHKSLNIEFHFHDNQNSSELICQEKKKGFDYLRPGLFRILVNDLGLTFDLIISIHNAIEDGWSMATLLNEFSQSYINNKPLTKPLEVKYGEYVFNELAASKNQDNKNFWIRYLHNVTPLKVSWQSKAEKSSNSLFESFFALESNDVMLIHAISKRLKITNDCFFLLAYITTLSHLTKVSDITIGISSHNRLEKEDGDKLFGNFINNTPFRFDLQKHPTHLKKLLGIFRNKTMMEKYKSFPYNSVKTICNKELYEFIFVFVHMHNLSDRANGMVSIEGYERTHIPFTLTVVQKAKEAFILSMSSHDDFISKTYLDIFTKTLKENIFKLIQI